MDTPKRAKAPASKSTTSVPKTTPRVVRTAPPRPSRRTLAPRTAPAFDEIARRAYEIYLGRNGGPGDPTADWLQAERELTPPPKAKARRGPAASA
jgi:Protein of unknown function (DUF2934)